MTYSDQPIAVITGGSRGIGSAVSKKMAALGYHVYVNFRSSEEAAMRCVQEIDNQGGTGTAIQADVSKIEEVQRMFNAIAHESGRIDVLVNNAGITKDQLLLEITDDTWREILDINLSSVFYCSRAVMMIMMKQKFGRIINLSSIAATQGGVGQSAYAATKSGIEGFTRALSAEIASRNITVNAIAPGVVETEMIGMARSILDEKILPMIPMKRYAQPKEVAELVAFLASKEAGYITGQVIPINGGIL